MAEVAFHDVGKIFPDGTVAVTDLTCTVRDGEFMVLVGPPGCRKTTALRMVPGWSRRRRAPSRSAARS
jgi:multiple sugar transport system ATP-binding protein